MNSISLRSVCKTLASSSVVAGGVGMVLSFLYLASASMADITAGTSGFVAGAILIGSGLLSLTLLSIHEKSGREAHDPEQTW